MIRASAILLLFFLATASPASAQFDKVLKGLGDLSECRQRFERRENRLRVARGVEGRHGKRRRPNRDDGRLSDEQGDQDPDAEIAADHRKAAAHGRLRSADRRVRRRHESRRGKGGAFCQRDFLGRHRRDDLRRRAQNSQRQRHGGDRLFQIEDFQETSNGLPAVRRKTSWTRSASIASTTI